MTLRQRTAISGVVRLNRFIMRQLIRWSTNTVICCFQFLHQNVALSASTIDRKYYALLHLHKNKWMFDVKFVSNGSKANVVALKLLNSDTGRFTKMAGSKKTFQDFTSTLSNLYNSSCHYQRLPLWHFRLCHHKFFYGDAVTGVRESRNVSGNFGLFNPPVVLFLKKGNTWRKKITQILSYQPEIRFHFLLSRFITYSSFAIWRNDRKYEKSKNESLDNWLGAKKQNPKLRKCVFIIVFLQLRYWATAWCDTDTIA